MAEKLGIAGALQRPTTSIMFGDATSKWKKRNYCFALGQSHIRPTEVSAKVRNRPADHQRPGKHCPAVGQVTIRFTPRRARPCRASRGTKPRGRATTRVPRPMHPSEPGKNVPRPAEKPSAKSQSARPRRPTMISSDRPSQRRGRPEARFEARFHIFKPGLTLSRLKRPSTIYIAF
ncbi:unnamed protein product [Microthlaspi erraticum]|uniref:Uncharacterized protein n=1 Tax=Microthlaspi erraticum TaxID=1685480 RepID=A0A6D2KB32_9BRAS|nr:unnamed protein product [Microthlaspi erraticum]